MDHEQVRTLEDEIETAVTAVIEKHFRRRKPKVAVGRRTQYLMAKAAVAVLEAVIEDSR